MLRLNKEDVIICKYTIGSGQDGTAKTLSRRAYWLVDYPKFIFVHYFDKGLAKAQKSE